MESNAFQFKKKVYVIKCEKEDCEESDDYCNSEKSNFLQSLRDLPLVEVVENLKIVNVQRELEKQEFADYSTIMLLIMLSCNCDSKDTIKKIFESFRKNNKLRCITKIVLSYGSGKSGAEFLKTRKGSKQNGIPKDFDKRSGEYSLKTEGKTEYLLKIESSIEKIENINNVDNLVYICCQRTERRVHGTIFSKALNFLLQNARQQSIQGIFNTVWSEAEIEYKAKSNRREGSSFSPSTPEMICFMSTSIEGCYFHSINPALAIIFNHFTFPKHSKRQGSHENVEAWKRILKLYKISFLAEKDASAEQVHDIMARLEKMDLSMFKYLLVIVMSHGTENEIIFTKTEEYKTNDIIEPLSRNKTLENVKKFVIFNACRGGKSPEYQVQTYEATDWSELDDTWFILYSAIKGYKSLRVDDDEGDDEVDYKGAYVVQEICKNLDSCEKKMPLKDIAEKTENTLVELEVYKDRDYKYVTEVCCKSPEQHVLEMLNENMVKFEEPLKALVLPTENPKRERNEELKEQLPQKRSREIN